MTVAIAHPSLQLLGRWRLRNDGADVAMSGPGQRLVALLGLRGGQPRARLAATLWPGREPAEARKLLRQALWTATRVVPGLILSGTTLALLPGTSVDTRTLEALAHAIGAGRAFLDDAVRALVLDAPDLLVGWYDDWVDEERERLTELRLGALEVLGERLVQAGASTEALAVAEAGRRLDPLREGIALVEMRVHLAMGNPALAVRCYHDLRDGFRQDFGVDPDVRCLDLVRPYVPSLG